MKFFIVALVIATFYTTATFGMSVKTDLECMVESIDTVAGLREGVRQFWTTEVRETLVGIRDAWAKCKSMPDRAICRRDEAIRFTSPYSVLFSKVFRNNKQNGWLLLEHVRNCGVFKH